MKSQFFIIDMKQSQLVLFSLFCFYLLVKMFGVKVGKGVAALSAFFGLLLLNFAFITPAAGAQDPNGQQTLLNNPGAPADYVWVLVAGSLVFFMQAGFAMVEAGFLRIKNTVNLMAKNYIDFCIATIAFFAVGYALMMGPDVGGIIGAGSPFLHGSYDVGTYLEFFWMLVFAGTSATIVAGAVAERIKFKAYLIYTVLLSLLIYPIYGHWVWGGGWLSKLPFGSGAVDFAGSGVVHAVGGFVGLAGAIVLGPRFGKIKEGKPQAIPGHALTLATLGAFILWFGWYGFNCGSTYSAHELRIAIIAVNTTLAAATGALTALMLSKWGTGRWDVGLMINGSLAGLVAITAPCAWVEGWAAVLIGMIGGIIMYVGVRSLDMRGIDDPVGAVAVHGFNGIWGLISVGIFADGTYGVTGLLYGNGVQLIAQLISAVVVFTWAFGMGLLIFKVMDRWFGIRVPPEIELQGLDVREHGCEAYPEFISKG
ncbi:MAG: ammonium transporter [Candidatus Hadarchaeales archaeon]